MPGVVVIGSQWGDEGKGKVVDWLSERAQVVVRFQGGHNAGHTLVVNKQTYKLALLPSGVVRPEKLSIVGNGTVINPWELRKEISRLTAQGLDISNRNLKISEAACLILPLHWQLDELREKVATGSIGTTKRGIGPAYEDKVGRRAIRVADLRYDEILKQKISILKKYHDLQRVGLGCEPINAALLFEELCEIRDFLLPYATVCWQLLDDCYQQGKRVLFEGAQGVMLDLDHGTFPYVTSSNTVAGQAATGSGGRLRMINFVLGLTKAYTTRVGSGILPTEQANGIGKQLAKLGKEVGTNTGRDRRCGWFDAVIARQAIKIAGIDGIALTKMDILDTFAEIKICTAYKLGNKTLDYLPACLPSDVKLEPVYETMRGWQSSTSGLRSWVDLPLEANMYVRRLEELIGVPVTLLSTSPRREDTICIKDPFLT